jgi:hypothetical protein
VRCATDINVPYNIERLLYYLSGENAEKVREWMTHLEQSPNGKVKFDEVNCATSTHN